VLINQKVTDTDQDTDLHRILVNRH